MGRLDWKSGRFSPDYELTQINQSLRGWQSEFGDTVLWYRYFGEETEVHDVWDEATGAGRVWHPAQEVKVLHATHVEGSVEDRSQGYYYNDSLYVTASFDELRRLGLTELDLQYESYIRDRIVYDYRVFRVTKIEVTGQIQRRDAMVSIEGTQVKPDEMMNDQGFEAFANPTFPDRP